jgi:type I site-specific restriction-modification system R (restriction) subunit
MRLGGANLVKAETADRQMCISAFSKIVRDDMHANASLRSFAAPCGDAPYEGDDFVVGGLVHEPPNAPRKSYRRGPLLVLKLPAPIDEDLAKGILEAIDMDSYRVEKKTALKILLPDDNAEIEPIPVNGGGRQPEAELDRLSNILKTFNEQFGTLFTDADRVVRRITEDIVPKVAADQPYLNAKKNTPNAARIELDAALMRVINPLLKDDTEFYKQFVQNESFKRFVTDMVANLTSE